MRLIRFLAVVAGLSAISGLAHAQGVGASGGIRATVTDPTGAVIAKANVTVSDAGKGVHRAAAADNTGGFVIPGLLPATYEVKVEAPGFETEVHRGVVVNVGQTVELDFHLKVSASKEEVVVNTAPPVVDTERGQQANVIEQQYIQDLPIDRRDYLTFTLLTPGVTSSEKVNGADYRVRQTPQTGLSFYGGNGRGNNVTVDGGEFNGDSGAVLVNLSQDAVQEFQINRTNYTAELGSASGASINIVSKTGTNNLHGTAYGFFRNDMFDASDPYAGSNALQPGQLSAATGFSYNATSQHVKNSLNRQQFGGTLGFALQKDRTFLFLSGEGLHERKTTSVTLLTNSNIFAPNTGQSAIFAGLASQPNMPVPCLTGQPAIPSATCAAILQSVLTINPAANPRSRFLVNEFETNGGLFQAPVTNAFYSGRLDHNFSDRNQAYIRYLYGRSDDGNPDVNAFVGASRGSSVKQWTNSILGSWYHQFSAKTQNELRAQWNLVDFNVYTNDPGGPGFDLAGFGAFGRDITLPDFSTLRQYEFADNFTRIFGHHTMKAGAYELIRGNRTESATFLGGNFSFSSLPGGILSPCLQVPQACATSGGSSLFTAKAASLTSLQAFNFGLPAYYQQGFGNSTTVANLPLTSFYWQDAWNATSNFTLNYGVRYELDQRWVMPTDHANFAPRVSFAWDPFKDHKTVVRGGAGIFYAPTYVQIDFATKELGQINNQRNISNFLVPLFGLPGSPALTSAAIFQTLFAQGKLGGCGLSGGPAGAGQGACIAPGDLTQFGINVSNVGAPPPFSAFWSVPSKFHNPYSEQVSFGIEHEFAGGMSFGANYIYVHTLRLPRTVDTNLLPTAPMVTQNGATFQSWGAPPCKLLVGNPCFVNPLVLWNIQYQSNAAAIYNGATFEFKKKFSNHSTLMANYTYSKAVDDATDFSNAFAPTNEANYRLDRGPSAYDQRHKITVAGVFDSPWKHWSLTDFELAPIIRYNSGQPFNVNAPLDLNGDNHSNDRPVGVGRNSGRGTNYSDVDLRLSRAFKITERAKLQFMAEAFNLFNRTNYSSLNNTCTSDPAGLNSCNPYQPFAKFQGANRGLTNTSSPFAYTAVDPMRELQFGVRLSF